MKQERWFRIIPVALLMYTISYVDRTNISLALDPSISSMMRDLAMTDTMKGQAAGIFFFGYVLLQIPSGYLASHWSPKKLISIFLVLWGISAVGCGLVANFDQFRVMRFMLGVTESGVFPATLVLLANWFPKAERARANCYWNLCQPLAVAASAPFTGLLLAKYGWHTMIVMEGALPFVWLPIWLYFISDHPAKARWISAEERTYLENKLEEERAQFQSVKPLPVWRAWLQWPVALMLIIYFLHNCAAYGCMTFFTDALKEKHFEPVTKGILFAIPYVVTAIMMVIVSNSSDRKHERRGHAAFAYLFAGSCLVISILVKSNFWLSYGFLCFAISGPFVALAPFWSIPSETMPRNVVGAVMGLVNALGNVGGYYGNYFVGTMKVRTHSIDIPFQVLGAGMLVGGLLCLMLPKTPIFKKD